MEKFWIWAPDELDRHTTRHTLKLAALARVHRNLKNWFARVFTKACTAGGVRQLHLHCTRHTFASILLMNNESIAYVSKQLGHSSIKMTVDTYGHWIPGANRQAVNKLPALNASLERMATWQ